MTDLQRVYDDPQAKSLARVKAALRDRAGKGASRKKALREPHTSIVKVEQDRDRKNSRRKGNRNELDVAKLFSRWCGEVVRRTPGSGGWSSARFGVTADLVCPKKAFPFHVEVKHREGWLLDDLVTGVRREHDKSVVQWWRQCTESCPTRTRKDGVREFRKTPLLVFRRNHQPWLVMFQWTEWRARMADFDGVDTIQTTFYDITEKDCLDDESASVVVMKLDSFITHTPVPKGLRNHR